MNRSSCKNKIDRNVWDFCIYTFYFLPSGETFVGMQLLAVRIFAIKGVLNTWFNSTIKCTAARKRIINFPQPKLAGRYQSKFSIAGGCTLMSRIQLFNRHIIYYFYTKQVRTQIYLSFVTINSLIAILCRYVCN